MTSLQPTSDNTHWRTRFDEMRPLYLMPAKNLFVIITHALSPKQIKSKNGYIEVKRWDEIAFQTCKLLLDGFDCQTANGEYDKSFTTRNAVYRIDSQQYWDHPAFKNQPLPSFEISQVTQRVIILICASGGSKQAFSDAKAIIQQAGLTGKQSLIIAPDGNYTNSLPLNRNCRLSQFERFDITTGTLNIAQYLYNSAYYGFADIGGDITGVKIPDRFTISLNIN